MSSGGPRIGRQRMLDPSMLRADATGMEVPDGLGPVQMKPAQTEGGNPFRRIILPGNNYPPAGSIPFDETGDVDLAFNTSGDIVTITVPNTLTAHVAGIGFGADDESNLRFITWSILGDPPGTPIQGYNNRAGAIGSIQFLADISVDKGAINTLRVNVLSASTLTSHYVCRIRGWFYNEKAI